MSSSSPSPPALDIHFNFPAGLKRGTNSTKNHKLFCCLSFVAHNESNEYKETEGKGGWRCDRGEFIFTVWLFCAAIATGNKDTMTGGFSPLNLTLCLGFITITAVQSGELADTDECITIIQKKFVNKVQSI